MLNFVKTDKEKMNTLISPNRFLFSQNAIHYRIKAINNNNTSTRKLAIKIFLNGEQIAPEEESFVDQNNEVNFFIQELLHSYMTKYHQGNDTTRPGKNGVFRISQCEWGQTFKTNYLLGGVIPNPLGTNEETDYSIHVLRGRNIENSRLVGFEEQGYNHFIQELVLLNNQPTNKRTSKDQIEFIYIFSTVEREINIHIEIEQDGNIKEFEGAYTINEKHLAKIDVSHFAINELAEKPTAWKIKITSSGEIELPTQSYVLDGRTYNQRQFMYLNQMNVFETVCTYGWVDEKQKITTKTARRINQVGTTETFLTEKEEQEKIRTVSSGFRSKAELEQIMGLIKSDLTYEVIEGQKKKIIINGGSYTIDTDQPGIREHVFTYQYAEDQIKHSLIPQFRPVQAIVLTANVVSPNQVNLYWNNPYKSAQFHIYRGKTQSSMSLLSETQNTSEFQDFTPEDGTQYYYQVKVFVQPPHQNTETNIVEINTPMADEIANVTMLVEQFVWIDHPFQSGKYISHFVWEPNLGNAQTQDIDEVVIEIGNKTLIHSRGNMSPEVKEEKWMEFDQATQQFIPKPPVFTSGETFQLTHRTQYEHPIFGNKRQSTSKTITITAP